MAIVLIGEEVAWYHAAAIAFVVGGLGLINLAKVRAAKAASAPRRSPSRPRQRAAL
jgi:hypothetical protein